MSAMRCRAARDWADAERLVLEHADGRPVEYGVGNRYQPGAVLAVARDAWNDGRGYNVSDVDSLGVPRYAFTITINPEGEA